MTGEEDPQARHAQIDSFLDWLRVYWHEHPFLRLGQIIHHVARELKTEPHAVDDVMIPYALGQIDARRYLPQVAPEEEG